MKRLLLSLFLLVSLHAAGPVRCAFDTQVVNWNYRCLTNNVILRPNYTWTSIASSVFMGGVRSAGLYPGNLLRVNLFCGRSYGNENGTDGAGSCIDVGCYELGGPQMPLIVDAGGPRDTANDSGVDSRQGWWYYKEVGVDGGLRQLSTNQPVALNTTVIPNTSLELTNVHLGFYVMAGVLEHSVPIGVYDAVNFCEVANTFSSAQQISVFGAVVGYPATANTNGAGFFLGTRTSSAAGGIQQYRNGVTTGDSTSTGGALTIVTSIIVFAQRNNLNAAQAFTTHPMGGYTIGRGLTSAQQLAYYNTWQSIS